MYFLLGKKNHSRIEEKCNLMLAIVFQHIFIIQSYVFELSTTSKITIISPHDFPPLYFTIVLFTITANSIVNNISID